MPEKVERRSALAEIYRTGSFGLQGDGGPGVRLTERRALSIVEIQAWPDAATAVRDGVGSALGLHLPHEPNRAVLLEDGTSAIAIGPDRWLVVERERRDLYGLLRAALGENQAAVTDQGHGRVGLRLEGRNVRDLLSKGTSVDLRPSRFPPGQSAGTKLDHVAVLLHCLDRDRFDLFALRSYAVSLYEWILDAALEFGCRVEDPI